MYTYIYIYIYIIYIYISGTQSEIFQGREGFWKKRRTQNTWKKNSAGDNFGVFFPRYSKNSVSNNKFNIQGIFFPKSGHFFSIFTKGQGSPPLKLAKILKILKILRLRFWTFF